MLSEFVNDNTNQDFTEFLHFKKVLNPFLKTYNLPNQVITDQVSFDKLKMLLQDIYSDTPLIIPSINKKITVNVPFRPTSEKIYFFGFKIEEI